MLERASGGEPRGRGLDLVFYDRDCGLCNGWVMFLLERDPEGSRFLYAPLQGATFRDRVPEVHAVDPLSSMVVLSSEGAVLFRSTAVIHLLKRVGGAWMGASIALSIVPRPVRDLGYRFIAAVRGRWFKQIRARCRLMPPGARERFLA